MKSKSNIVLIGMPGAGKSTVGVLLAKALGRYFLDTDIYIQALEDKPLQQIKKLRNLPTSRMREI
jgi:shikimate kinase